MAAVMEAISIYQPPAKRHPALFAGDLDYFPSA
jgi:hypothetical protein